MAREEDAIDRILEQWRRERPDLDLAALGTVGRLFRVTQLADGLLAEGLAARGLRPGWFDLLAALRRSGVPYRLNPAELIRTTMLSSGGMTKRLDRLEEAGLVERSPDPADRRGTLVGLTPEGKEAIDASLPMHAANEERLLASLSAAQRRTLDDLLRAVLTELDPPSSS